MDNIPVRQHNRPKVCSPLQQTTISLKRDITRELNKRPKIHSRNGLDISSDFGETLMNLDSQLKVSHEKTIVSKKLKTADSAKSKDCANTENSSALYIEQPRKTTMFIGDTNLKGKKSTKNVNSSVSNNNKIKKCSNPKVSYEEWTVDLVSNKYGVAQGRTDCLKIKFKKVKQNVANKNTDMKETKQNGENDNANSEKDKHNGRNYGTTVQTEIACTDSESSGTKSKEHKTKPQRPKHIRERLTQKSFKVKPVIVPQRPENAIRKQQIKAKLALIAARQKEKPIDSEPVTSALTTPKGSRPEPPPKPIVNDTKLEAFVFKKREEYLAKLKSRPEQRNTILVPIPSHNQLTGHSSTSKTSVKSELEPSSSDSTSSSSSSDSESSSSGSSSSDSDSGEEISHSPILPIALSPASLARDKALSESSDDDC